MDVSKNSGTPKSSILIGFSIINHPFLGTPIFGNTRILLLGVFFAVFCQLIFGLDEILHHLRSTNLCT